MSKPTKRKCPSCHEVKTFRSDVKTCGCRGNRPLASPELKESSEIKDNQWTISLPKTRIHTLEQLVEYCQIDLSVWEVERFVANKWEMGYKDPDGNARAEQLYQIKAFLRRKRHIVTAKCELIELKEQAKKNALEPPKVLVTISKGSGKMLELNLTDHHFGKLAWAKETGFVNYDTKIAVEVWNRAISTLLERAKNYEYEEIWFIVGNDLFNSDDVQGRTTAGTQVETDLRYERTYRIVREILVNTIEELRKHTKKVKVVVVSGNHDHNSTWHMGDSLECYFSKYKDVEVDNNPKVRKYHTFGTTLLGYTHGHFGKRADLPMLMATEVPQLFGESKFREFHTGHNHAEITTEKNGVVVRVLSTLCAPDAWHSQEGYVGNRRSSQAFQWDKKEGLVGMVVYTDNDEKI